MKELLLAKPMTDASGPAPGTTATAGVSPYRLLRWLLVTGLVFALTISRRPDALLIPQFWAEDGSVWYADARNLGAFQAVLVPYAGYLNMLPRLVAAVAVGLPMQYAPAFFNVVAIVIQVLPVFFLLSGRLDRAVPNPRARLLLAIIAVAVPNSWESGMNLTNVQWHLAILALLVALASLPERWPGRVFDLSILVMSGLTGPFAILLAPVLGLRWIARRERWILGYLGIDIAAAAVQSWVLIAIASRQRGYPPIGLQPVLMLKLLADQIGLPALIGHGGTAALSTTPLWHTAPLVLAGFAGLLVCAAAALLGTLELRLLLLYAGLQYVSMFLGGQLAPDASIVVQGLGNGQHYYLLPMLAWLAVLVWMLSRSRTTQPGALLLLSTLQRSRPAQIGAVILLCSTLSIGVIEDWQYPPFVDLGWTAEVHRFEQAPPGTLVAIPLNPPGWVMNLRR